MNTNRTESQYTESLKNIEGFREPCNTCAWRAWPDPDDEECGCSRCKWYDKEEEEADGR